ncbi:MAG TPA: hypothetical protein VFB04_05320 [Terriglobales bacterium]|nr:hypothetical protein [Terriglobales bacterium]
MELDELRNAWEMLGQQLNRQSAINLAMYNHQKVTTIRSSLRPLLWGQALQLCMGIVAILFAAILWTMKPAAVPVIAAGAIVHLYGILCVVGAGVLLNGIRRIDYSGSVLEMQDRLARMGRAYIVSGIVLGLSWWFLWMPFLMVLLALVHVNLYANAPALVWIGTAVGVAGLAGMLCLYRYSRMPSHDRLRRFVDGAVIGRSLQRAQAQLDEVRQFAQEAA